MSERLFWPEVKRRFVDRKFRRRRSGVTETLKVIDCTLGGDVLVRRWRDPFPTTIPQKRWLEWVKDAKEVK